MLRGLLTRRVLRRWVESIGAADILKKRPALGLRDRHAATVIGATLTAAVEKDQPLTWDVLSFGKGL